MSGAANLSLYVELADVSTGHVAWAQTFHGPLREAELGEGRLMRQVVAAVHSAVLSHELDRSRDLALPALEGHTLLLSSIGLMHRLAPADTERARAMLEHLIERGRGQPAPHAWLAHLHVLQLRQRGAGPADVDAGAARQHAAAALQCDPGSVRALAMQGQAWLYAAHDPEAAQDCYAQALGARPDDALALVLQAELRALQGLGGAAQELAQRAMASFPVERMHYLFDGVLALAALVAGDPPLAVACALRAVERNPQYLPAWRTLVVAQVRGGRLADARRTAAKLALRAPAGPADGPASSLPACSDVAALFNDALREAGSPPPA